MATKTSHQTAYASNPDFQAPVVIKIDGATTCDHELQDGEIRLNGVVLRASGLSFESLNEALKPLENPELAARAVEHLVGWLQTQELAEIIAKRSTIRFG